MIRSAIYVYKYICIQGTDHRKRNFRIRDGISVILEKARYRSVSITDRHPKARNPGTDQGSEENTRYRSPDAC